MQIRLARASRPDLRRCARTSADRRRAPSRPTSDLVHVHRRDETLVLRLYD